MSSLSTSPFRWLQSRVAGLGVALLAAPLLAASAYAQVVDIPAMVAPERRGPPTAVSFQTGHQFQTDIEVNNNDAEMARTNAAFTIGHRFDLSEETSLFTLGTYSVQSYHFQDNNSPNPYQWNEIHRAVLGGVFGWNLDDNWRVLGGGIVRSWGETGASYGDSISGGVILGFDYLANEDFSAGLLIGVLSSLEGGIGILPVPTIDWKFAEDWTLHTGMVNVMDPGIGADVRWQVGESTSIGAGFAFQTRQYRLRDKTRAGGTPGHPNRTDDGGVGRETGLPIFGTVRWQPTQRSMIDLLGGVTVAGNLRVEDEDGGRIRDDDFDPAGFLALKGSIVF